MRIRVSVDIPDTITDPREQIAYLVSEIQRRGEGEWKPVRVPLVNRWAGLHRWVWRNQEGS